VATAPTVIGRYQIVRRLGAGGMGTVFLARDPELDRHVAVKLVKDDLTDDPDLRARFSREARSAARLQHPNIVTVFDIGEHEGQPFIAMEYVPGESLADVVRRNGPLDLSRVLRWMESLCSGLAHAHRAGIVHRDIKPANMMVGPEGALKIVDFGIARLADSHMTREGVLVGTINYMAPEQILGSGADHRADIFAVGAVFHELLCFRKAFPGTIADGLFTRICHEPPEPLAQACPGLDPAIIAAVSRALDKDPARRYQDLAIMSRDVALIRGRLEEAGEVDGTITIASYTPSAGLAGGTMTPLPQGTDSSLQRVLVELEQARDRSERLRTSLDRARQALSQSAFDSAIAAADETLALDPTVGEARDILRQARAALDERQRQSAIDAARRVVEAARTALEAGDDSAALALLDAVKAPTETLAAAVAELRMKIADTHSKRQRRAAIFVDAAELALAQRDYAKALALLDDAERVDAALPSVAPLRAQAEGALAAVREAERTANAVDGALREANAALARGDFVAARQHVGRALAADPQNWQAAGVLTRVLQAERAAQQRSPQHQSERSQTRRSRFTLWSVVGVAVGVAAAVLVYLLTR
jgi:eukaryotic-like serine/threonine-protein kinase